jgi:DNA invertase Pin-like site-specific DNA recombinase
VNPRVAIWTAVSSQPQTEKSSLDDQEQAGRRFADSIDGDIVAIYTVPGLSRDLIFWEEAERKITAYRRLREDCEAGKFDILWALDPDRLGRDPALSNQVFSLVEKSGAEVYLASAPHPIGQATAGHRYVYAIQSVRAQEDQALRVKRWRFGTRDRIRRGLPANNWPLGYRPVRDPETGETIGGELDPALAPAVEFATELFLAGESYAEIRRRLIDSPYRPPRTDTWSYSTVHKMFQNDTYAGYPSWDGVVAPEPSDLYPAIWDEETYEEILRERERRGKRQYNYTEGSPVSGVAFCARCGSYMSRILVRGKTWWLRCTQHAKKSATGKSCHPNHLKEEDVIIALGEYLKKLTDPEKLAEEMDRTTGDTKNLDRDLETVEERLLDIKRQRERLALTLAAGKMDTQIYRSADDQLQEQAEGLKQQRRELQKQIAHTPDHAALSEAIASIAQAWPHLVEKARAPRIRKLLQDAGIRVECDDGDIDSIAIASF